MYPGAVPCARLFTSPAGGRNSGRERKDHGSSPRAGEATALARGLRSQPKAPVSMIHAPPAATVPRHLCRVIFAPKSLPFHSFCTVTRTCRTAVTFLLASGAALALPSEKPNKTPMVNGRVRAIEQVGTNIWLGGKFTQVKSRDGTVIANVSNLAVFDSQTNQFKNIAPKLGGKDSEVWDMATYRGDVLIAGEFPGPSSKENNLVRVDGKTGQVIKWF